MPNPITREVVTQYPTARSLIALRYFRNFNDTYSAFFRNHSRNLAQEGYSQEEINNLLIPYNFTTLEKKRAYNLLYLACSGRQSHILTQEITSIYFNCTTARLRSILEKPIKLLKIFLSGLDGISLYSLENFITLNQHTERNALLLTFGDAFYCDPNMEMIYPLSSMHNLVPINFRPQNTRRLQNRTIEVENNPINISATSVNSRQDRELSDFYQNNLGEMIQRVIDETRTNNRNLSPNSFRLSNTNLNSYFNNAVETFPELQNYEQSAYTQARNFFTHIMPRTTQLTIFPGPHSLVDHPTINWREGYYTSHNGTRKFSIRIKRTKIEELFGIGNCGPNQNREHYTSEIIQKIAEFNRFFAAFGTQITTRKIQKHNNPEEKFRIFTFTNLPLNNEIFTLGRNPVIVLQQAIQQPTRISMPEFLTNLDATGILPYLFETTQEAQPQSEQSSQTQLPWFQFRGQAPLAPDDLLTIEQGEDIQIDLGHAGTITVPRAARTAYVTESESNQNETVERTTQNSPNIPIGRDQITAVTHASLERLMRNAVLSTRR